MEPDQRGSRTFLTAVLLTIAGGYLDAYTYFVRGGVFANAQTANVVKLGIAAAEMNLEQCLFYLWPILAFTAGVMLSLWIEDQSTEYPRRLVLAMEILFMIIISFLPVSETLNIISNIMVSFLCAMQMQTFQIFRRQGIATTVATGNLRKAVECLYKAVKEKDRKQLRIAMAFFSIILLFITGVILGTLFSRILSIRSILIPASLLVVVFIHITDVYRKYRLSAAN